MSRRRFEAAVWEIPSAAIRRRPAGSLRLADAPLWRRLQAPQFHAQRQFVERADAAMANDLGGNRDRDLGRRLSADIESDRRVDAIQDRRCKAVLLDTVEG